MKKLGKRILSMTLAFGLTASMLISDLAVMQVNAAGNDAAVEIVTEDLIADENLTENSTEEIFSTEVVTEESVVEEVSGEEPETEEVVAEETATEEITIEEGVTEDAIPVEETTAEETSVEETIVESEEDITVEETTEEASTEENFPVDGNTTLAAASSGFTLEVTEDGVLTVVLDEGVTKISGSIEIPKEAVVIPKSSELFYGNYDVTAVTFEDGSLLERIEDEAFFSSTITEIKIPANVTYIGNRAFCATSLKKVTLLAGDGAITLGEMAFASNKSLATFITNGRLDVIGNSAFSGDSVLKSFIGITSYDNVALDGVTSIGASAFAGCSALEYIKIPDTVSVIEEGTFKDCVSLGKSVREYYTGARAVELGNGVREIKNSAFAGCTGLEELILRESVAKVGADAFLGCNALANVKLYNQDGEDKTEACAVELTYTSFPHKKGLVLEAYDGTVKDWVGTHSIYGVKFTSLYKSYSITYSDKIKNGTIKANVTSAKMGTKVVLTITPKTGYVLDSNSLYFEGTNGEDGDIIDAWNPTFTMPDYNIKVYGSFRQLEKDEYGTKLMLSEEYIIGMSSEDISYDESKQILTFPKTWQNAQIRVTGETGMMPGYSELEFESSNTKVVTVDEYGNLRTLAPGEATITVELADETLNVEPLKLTVKVDAKAYVKDFTVAYSDTKGTVIYESEDEEYDIISFPSSLLSIGSQKITVSFKGTDEDGDAMDATYQLSANDKTVAKPQVSKVIGSGVIVVPKGASGETVITVKAVDGSQTPVKKQFIVRVIDDKPRLVSSEITVDPQSDTGTLLDLVTVYESSLDLNELSIVKKKVKSGTTTWEDADDLFELNVDGDNVYLQAIEDEENPFVVGKEYKYENKYYIHGTLSETDEDFYILIPSITIIKKNISTPMKVSGKINLFYNGLATVDQLGSVTVKQKNKKTGLILEDCELVGTKTGTKYANGVNEDDNDAFAENFTATLDPEKQIITITRTEGDEALSLYSAGESKNKPVLSGVLKVWYEGYSTDYYDEIEITVPTHTTAPSYKLDTTKITLNENAFGQEFLISFINKKAKKDENPKVDLTENTILKLDQQSGSGTTPGLVEASADGSLDVDYENDTISLKISQAKKGKIVIRLLQAEWEDQSMWNTKSVMKKTITVSTTTKAPTAKLGKSTLTLNAACPEATDYTTMVLNQTDSVLAEDQVFDPVDAEKSANLEVTYNSEDNTITAAITGEGVATGKHKFVCYPEYIYEGSSSTRTAKKITVTVKVNNTQPSIKLKKSTFTVNANAYSWDDRKFDSMTQEFTWSNLPAEYSDYTLSTENMVLEYTGKGVDPLEGRNSIRLDVDVVEKTATVYLEFDSKLIGKSSYNVKGLELVSEENDTPISVKPFKITVNSINKAPKVTVKAKGSINPLNPESKIEYTPTLSNINGTITDVVIREFDENNYSLITRGEEHFEAIQDPETGKTIVTVKEEKKAELENRSYKIQLYYELSNGEDGDGWLAEEGLYQVAKDQKITLKQTMPTLSIDKKEATFLAGNKERTQIITITKKKTKEAVITDIKFSDKTSQKLQNAFEIIGFDSETGEMELKLKNSAFIAQNVEQTLTFEIVCEGQLKDTKGKTFTIKVKVLK